MLALATAAFGFAVPAAPLASLSGQCTPTRTLWHHPAVERQHAASMSILEAVADGDIAAAVEVVAIGVGAALGAGAAWSLVQREQDSPEEGQMVDDPLLAAPTTGSRAVSSESDKLAVHVDLGADGEPKGVCRLLFKPLLPRSELVLLELRVPLGLLIEERDGMIVVNGALPGYSAFSQVEEGACAP